MPSDHLDMQLHYMHVVAIETSVSNVVSEQCGLWVVCDCLGGSPSFTNVAWVLAAVPGIRIQVEEKPVIPSTALMQLQGRVQADARPRQGPGHTCC